MFHWILAHLIHVISSGIFLSGAVVMPDFTTAAPEAGAGGESGSGDAGGEGDSGDGSGNEGDEGTGGEGGSEGNEENAEGQEGKAGGKVEEAKIDWRTVPQNVKAHLQALAKTDKTLANAIQNAVYTSQSMLREFPGGLKEAKALKTTIDEFGGVEEIQTLKSKYTSFVEEQENLDTQAREGNPDVLHNLVEVAGKDGFSKLMPEALNQWAQMDNENYSHVMGRVIVNAMREGGLVAEMNTAIKMLNLNTPEATKEAVESLKRVAEWANGINRVATTPPAKPKVDPNIETQQKALDDRQAKIFNDEFSSSFGSWRNMQIHNLVKTISNNRTLTDYQMSTLGSRVVQEIGQILTADPDYMKNIKKIYDSRNMDELQKFTRSRTSKLLPEVTRKAYRALFSDPTKKTTQKPADKTTKPGDKAATATATAPVSKDWIKIDAAKAPLPDQIDSKATSFEMKFRKQAILKDGRKVFWGTSTPKQ